MRRFLIVTVLTPFAFWANGATIDPQVQVRDAGESGGGGPGTVTVTGQLFTIFTPTGNSPVDSSCTVNGFSDQSCDLINGSGQAWTSLTITIEPGQSFDSCSVLDFFAACSFIQHGGSGLDSVIYLYGGGGVPDGQAFGISFSGWSADTQLIALANTQDTPEPTSSALVALVLIFCALFRVRNTADVVQGRVRPSY